MTFNKKFIRLLIMSILIINVFSGNSARATYDVYVSSTPSEAKIYYNGIDTGILTNNYVHIPVRGYIPVTITVQKKCYNEPNYQTAGFFADEMHTDLSFTLTPIPGSIKVDSNPGGAKIYLDGSPTEFITPKELTDISIGSHKVSVSLTDYTSNPVIQDVQVTCDVPANVYFFLTPIPPNPPPNHSFPWGFIIVALTILLAGFYLWIKSNLKLVPKQTTVPCDGKSTLPIKVQFVNALGKSRKQKKDCKVEMETTSGSIQNVVIPAGKESIEATLTSSNKCGPVTVTAKSGKQKANAKLNFEKEHEMKYCHNCSTKVGMETRKCPNCGKNPTFSDRDTKQCNKCEAYQPITANFCGNCGAPMPS